MLLKLQNIQCFKELWIFNSKQTRRKRKALSKVEVINGILFATYVRKGFENIMFTHKLARENRKVYIVRVWEALLVIHLL